MLHKLCIAGATLALTLCFTTPARADLTLIAPGAPAPTIVLPAETQLQAMVREAPAQVAAQAKGATPDVAPAAIEKQVAAHVASLKAMTDEELLAANELQTVLEKISGVKPAIAYLSDADAMPAGPKIVLGTHLARKQGLGERIDKLQPDGLICTVKGDMLILTGRRARGTIYAAYEFLESLGCRWVMPGEFGELYPTLATVTTSIDKTANPSHAKRYFWCTFGQGPGLAQWVLRNKGNLVNAPGDQTIAQSHALGSPLAAAARDPRYAQKVEREVEEKQKGPDGTVTTVKVKKEVLELPDEYFSMAAGQINKQVPNFRNPKVWDLYAEHYIKFFREHPGVDYVSISAEDGFSGDDRPESRKLSSSEYDWTLGAYSSTDQLWFFHNRVIERVVKVFPTKKFGVLVYANNMMPPRIEHVHPNMALVFAPLGISPLTAVGDPKEATNVAYKAWLEDWMAQARAVGAESYYYDYEPLGFCWNVAMICPRWGIIGKNYPYFHKLGLTGHTTQGHDDWGSCGLDNYLMQRLYWDVTQPYEQVIADYCGARFGKAGEAMQAYYKRLEKALDDAPDLYSNETWGNHLVLTPAVRKEARELLAKAVALADTDRAKAQIQAAVDVQTMTDAQCDALELASETGDFGAAAKKMEECFVIRDKLNKLYPFFVNPARTDPKSTAQYLTGGQYNQFLGFDKKIKGATASVALPRYWKGMLDSGSRAWASGFHKPEASVASLDDLDTTTCPDVKYKTQRQPAAFFYRIDADVPASFQGKTATLLFTSAIARAIQVWINGVPVEFDYKTYKDTTWRGPDYFWMDYNHEIELDVTPYLKPGQKNSIAVRMFKSYDFGGSYRRIFLLAK